MSAKSSLKSEENKTTRAQRWLTCPQCGQAYETEQFFCKKCHYYSPGWGTYDELGRRAKIRRRVLIIASIVLILLVSYTIWVSRDYIPNPLVLLVEPASHINSRPLDGEWTNFGHDLTNSRYVKEGKRVTGRVAWSVNLGPFTDSAPAVKDHTLYLGGYFKIYAIKTKTGEIVWEVETTGPVSTSPAIAGELVFFALLDGRVLALERATGKRVWEFKTGNYVFGSPIVVDGILYIGSGDKKVHALDAATGALIWNYQTGGSIPFSPVIDDDILYINSGDRTLYSLDAKTGALRLNFRSVWAFKDSPAMSKEFIYYVSTQGNLNSIRHGVTDFPGSHFLRQVWTEFWLWRFPVPFPPHQPGATWRISPADKKQKFVSSPAIAPGRLYLGDTSGRFYALDPEKGETIWVFKSGVPISSSPLVIGNTVFFGTKTGDLYSLHRDTGALNWKLSLHSPLAAKPAFGDGQIFLRTEDGLLHAID